MLAAAVHAPSAENTQPWTFIVVRDDRNRALLAAWWTETWNAGGGDFVKQSVEDKALVADLEFGCPATSLTCRERFGTPW